MPMMYLLALQTQRVPAGMKHEIKHCDFTSQNLNMPGSVSRRGCVSGDSGTGLCLSSADDAVCKMSHFRVLQKETRTISYSGKTLCQASDRCQLTAAISVYFPGKTSVGQNTPASMVRFLVTLACICSWLERNGQHHYFPHLVKSSLIYSEGRWGR